VREVHSFTTELGLKLFFIVKKYKKLVYISYDIYLPVEGIKHKKGYKEQNKLSSVVGISENLPN